MADHDLGGTVSGGPVQVAAFDVTGQVALVTCEAAGLGFEFANEHLGVFAIMGLGASVQHGINRGSEQFRTPDAGAVVYAWLWTV